MAYYNMDKRSDGVRCRRSLSAANRLDHLPPTPGLITPGLKEDKIRFLLEAAEAARGGSSAPRPAVPAPTGPFAGMSLGQYVNALSSCLPGSPGIRPLLWNPPFQPLPHDGVTSHAALLSTLATAPMPSVQVTTASAPAQPAPDRSILNSLLASYATGSPLFSINGLASAAATGLGTAEVARTPVLRCPSSEGPAVPQDLSMSRARDGCSGSKDTADMSFLSATTACSIMPTLGSGGGCVSKEMPVKSSAPHQSGLASQPADFRASDGAGPWSGGLGPFIASANVKQEFEATDLSIRSLEASEITNNMSPMVPNATAGTVDLSSRSADRKLCVPSPHLSWNRDRDSVSFPRDLAKSGSCCAEDVTCPHLAKLKGLRRNVYRMLSVFTPYLDVAGAGIADVEADSVDDFLHEVIYSSQLDQATN